MNIDRDKLYDGVIGLAIGDALGVPVEFYSREELSENKVTDMLSGGTWETKSGTWSDDTAMTLATIDALNKTSWEDSKLLGHIIMMNFELWYKTSKFACDNHRFDIGETCKAAIEHYNKFGHTETCGRGKGKCGNGALMRILPAAFLDERSILSISRLTHNNEECDSASLIYTTLIKELISGKDKIDAFESTRNSLVHRNISNEFDRLLCNNKFIDFSEEDIKSTGYVVHTLEAAIWCFLTTDNYKDCVLKAVNLGEDTDTVAAVAGGLAGIYYGIDGIPYDFKNKLRGLKLIQDICFNN